MDKAKLKKLLDTAAGRIPADLVIKNCKIADICRGEITEGDIAISDGLIAGIGCYEGKTQTDAEGMYAVPGFIDSHIHIESAYVTPEEIGRLLVPHGTTTIIADPHEIVNVCGLQGLQYMLDAAKGTALDIRYMLPSCVPSTPFEHSGAIIDAAAMKGVIEKDDILGLGEFMDYPGVINGAEGVLDKLLAAKNCQKIIDGHSPGITGPELNAYAAAGIRTDHECSTVEEMQDRLARGMYVLLRQGSACHNLRPLLKGLTPKNSRRCLLCSDDRQPKTILSEGHIDNHLRICVEEGVDALTALSMAALNAAECYRLEDRGLIAPGLRADIVLVDNLQEFHAQKVWIAGNLAAAHGEYLLPVHHCDTTPVRSSFHVKDFSKDSLKFHLASNHVHVIDILPGGVVTKKGTAHVTLSQDGDFVYNPQEDIVKAAVIERHHNTGNTGLGLLRGYGIRKGAVALSIAHDSHNIITVGVNDEDIEFAVQQLIRQGGGIVLARDNTIVEQMPLPLGGLMSDRSGEWVKEKLTAIHEKAYEELGISGDVEPVMTLCFMSLAVIPELKITDMGLFDVTKFDFIPIEATDS